MNIAKTVCCKPASTVSIIPVGLPVKLEYNEYGLLKDFTIGFDMKLDPTYRYTDAFISEFVDDNFKHEQLFHAIKKIVPHSISTKGGTTWVYGVCYSNRIPCDEGLITTSLIASYLKDMITGGCYRFYAGYVMSKAVSIQGYMIMKSFLGSAGFTLLPSTLVPVAITEQTIDAMVAASSYPFNKDFIAGFFIHENLNCRYAPSSLMQIKVTKVTDPYVDSDGFLKGDVTTGSGRTYTFDYSTIIHHDITKGCSLLVEKGISDARLVVICTRVNEISKKILNSKGQDIKCPICNKLYRVGIDDAPVQCDDPHCLSKGYQDVVKMLAVLNLPEMSYEKYRNLVDTHVIQCLTDVLELDPYNRDEIEATLAEAMYAVIPTSVVPNFMLLEKFANKCNNKVETVEYYLDSPLRIETDLDITDPIIRRFANWLDDPYNVSTLTTIFSQVKIIGKRQKFEGCPIFRGNTIAITGKFKRGDHPEIESILLSYSADVVSDIEPGQKLPNMIVIGSTQEGISGKLIQKARLHNIPIIYEDEFFTKFEIDKDMAENLL